MDVRSLSRVTTSPEFRVFVGSVRRARFLEYGGEI
jgi:hypothetical protein